MGVSDNARILPHRPNETLSSAALFSWQGSHYHHDDEDRQNAQSIVEPKNLPCHIWERDEHYDSNYGEQSQVAQKVFHSVITFRVCCSGGRVS